MTNPVAKRLSVSVAPTVLVDSSAVGHGALFETDWVSTGIANVGGVSPRATGYLARVPIYGARPKSEHERRKYDEICYLISLVQLMRRGAISALESAELEIEKNRQPARRYRNYAMFDYNIFQAVKFGRIDNDWASALFCEETAEQQSDRLSKLDFPEFQNLKEAFPAKSSLDAYHISLGDRHGVDYFLHMDFKLQRHLRQNAERRAIQRLKIKCVTPSELANELKVGRIHPWMLSYDGSSWPVRPDLHNNGKRRRVGEKGR